MLYFSSWYNVLLIVQEVFFMKSNGYYKPGWKTTKWYLATKKMDHPLQDSFRNSSNYFPLEVRANLRRCHNTLPSAKQEEIMLILFLIASSSTAIYPITPLLVFQAVYGRGKALTMRQHEGFANYQPLKPYFIMEGLRSAGVSNSLSVIVPP